MTTFARAAILLAEHGLGACGFHPTAEHTVPMGVRTIILASSATNDTWMHFQASPEFRDGKPDPMNRWSTRVLDTIGTTLGAGTAFPFGGPPHWQFLDWCATAEPLWPSPIGMYVHARYGLWYSCRGALTFTHELELPPRSQLARPCDTCVDQPCRTACPVDAFAHGDYDSARCAAHVRSPAGQECHDFGCLARHACPVGHEFRPTPARAQFHMQAFVTAPPQVDSSD